MRGTKTIVPWLTGFVTAWLGLPGIAGAQAPIPNTPQYPWQTIVHNQNVLYVDPGRVRFSIKKTMAEYAPTIDPTTLQWTDFNNAETFYYPIDEWAPQYISISGIAGGVESILRPDRTTPNSVEYQGNQRSSQTGDLDAWYYARRWRPPTILVGQDQIPINAPAEVEVDHNLPSNQAVFTINQNWTNVDGLSKTRNLYAMENTNLDRSMWVYEREWHKGEWTRFGGAGGDSTINLPPGQVISAYHGWRWMGEHARSVLLWTGSQQAPWNQQRQDDYGVTIEHASRYLTPAEVPRAANLQLCIIKDGYSDDLNDWDGSRFDDVGNPYLGPQFTRGDITRETGEFVGDGIIGEGYIYFARGDGAHDTDWFSATDPANTAPNNFFWSRYKTSNAPSGAEFGGTAGFWAKIKTVQVQRGGPGDGFITNYFSGLGANVDGIEWTGVNQAMVDGMPPWSAAEKFNSYIRNFMVGGPIILQPGDTHERVLVVCAGDLTRKESIAYGKRYLKWVASQKTGVHPNGDALPASVVPLDNLEKFTILEGVKDSIFSQYDRAFTAFHGGHGSGLTNAQKLAGEGLRKYPDPPPSPDVYITDGPARCDVYAWYPDETMFDDSDTGVDDFKGWRIYRKQGDAWVNTTEEIQDRGYRDWEMIAEIRADGVYSAAGQQVAGIKLEADHYNGEFTFLTGETRRVVHFGDINVVRGEPYFYAVSAFDDGSQNTLGFHPGESLEGPRYQTATAQGGVGISVTSFAPGISPKAGLALRGGSKVNGQGAASSYALSQDAAFDLNVGRGMTRAVSVTVSASATGDNTTIDQLVSDIQTAIDAAVGGNKVLVGSEAVGKAAAVAQQAEQFLTISTVQQNVVLSLSGLNSAARDELGLAGGQIGRFVVISPNPWALDRGAGLSSDQNQIFFDNLPPLCTLKIYTETGDLVQSIDHTSGSAQEVWYQVNQVGQLVKSGLYILAVLNAQDTDPLTGAPADKLDNQFVKFVIIR